MTIAKRSISLTHSPPGEAIKNHYLTDLIHSPIARVPEQKTRMFSEEHSGFLQNKGASQLTIRGTQHMGASFQVS